MTVVLDASAVLAFLAGEDGADHVEEALPGAVNGAANWSEVTQKLMSRGADVEVARSLLASYEVSIEPVGESDAIEAAALWRPGTGLSLGDRLCLALGNRLDVPVLTADRAWGDGGRIRQIRMASRANPL